MDPLSISVAIITLFQETYLLISYVYRTVDSASHSDSEREDVAASMRWELLMLESFGRWFTKANGSVTDDSMLDEVKCPYEQPLIETSADTVGPAALAERNTVHIKKTSNRFR